MEFTYVAINQGSDRTMILYSLKLERPSVKKLHFALGTKNLNWFKPLKCESNAR